jgi:8-oxo-dGTP diphosphatase
MKNRKDKIRAPILAAGGIVLRGDRKPQFAVVQLRKLGAWVLPKGKLAADEDAMAAARREVLEETGHRVTIHEFLGTLAHEASGRTKVIQFWRMQAIGEPTGDLMRDVKAVQWLALEDAIDQLTHPRERAFLEQVGPIALKSAERSARLGVSGERPARRNLIERTSSAARTPAAQLDEPFGPVADPVEHAEPIEQEPIEQDLGGGAGLVPAADVAAPEKPSMQTVKARETETTGGWNLIEKTWVWFRRATMPHHRPPLD